MFRGFRPLLFAALTGLICSFAFAQTPTGSIEGVVTDPQGNVVAGATVTATDSATGRVLTVTTGADGTYSV